MKIKSVKILGDDFRSLAANKLYEFNVSFRDDRLSTKIFAGLNGSGKSNFLELFSEIFYYLEIYHLDTVSEEEKASKSFGFEIEYYLPFVKPAKNALDFDNAIDFDMPIKIIKLLGERPEFSYVPLGKQDFIRLDEMTEYLLPPRVVAYTSGQNELLSNSYYKLKYHYFKTFEGKKKLEDGENISENHRLFFLDYSANFSIFIANMLLGHKNKVEFLKNTLQIDDLKSFRITLNTDDLYQRVIPVSDSIAENLEKLKLCSTTWVQKKVGKYNLLIIDFSIDSSIRESFMFHFKNAFNLFKVFYELEIFNLYLVNQTTRRQILNANKILNISDEMPKPDPSRLVFRIERIVISKIIEKGKPAKNIFYKSLSDGEHQFNEVVGTVMMMEDTGGLFLIDEPDTHFNPRWRAKFIKTLNFAAANSFDSAGNVLKVRKQELIMTTHSPFVISDSFSQDVYKFEKAKGMINYCNPDFQVYGSSVSIILDEIFEKSEGISEMAKRELKKMVENINSVDELRNVVERLNRDFGDSVEKFDLFSKLRNIKDELEKKEN